MSHRHDTPTRPPLELARAELDAIDHEIVRLLARRELVVEGLWAWKAATGRPLRDPEREAVALARVREHAVAAGLSADAVEAVFATIVGRRFA